MPLPLQFYHIKTWLFSLSTVLFLITVITACTYNNDLLDAVKQQQEFIFTLDDLEGYQNWTVIGTKERLDLGHFRTIYINKPEEANRTTGAYPLGTIIVKESRYFNDRTQVTRVQIMAKRGGFFNPEGLGWEWGLVSGDDLLQMERGPNTLTLNGETCYSCHAGYNDLVIKTY